MLLKICMAYFLTPLIYIVNLILHTMQVNGDSPAAILYCQSLHFEINYYFVYWLHFIFFFHVDHIKGSGFVHKCAIQCDDSS